jgi:methionyl-tRNA formyltransferase
MLKVVFAGTPEFAKLALEAIAHAGHEVVMVMTQPDRPAGRGLQLHASPVKQFAIEKNIPVMQPTSLKVSGSYGDEARAALSALQKLEFDVMVVAAYGLILPQEVFDIAGQAGRAGCLNIHASLLPRWRGAAPIHRAIEAGDLETGIAIMQMDLGLDTGAVIAVNKMPIAPNETTATLHDALAKMGTLMIVETLNRFAQERSLKSAPQALEGITYAHKIMKDEAKIDWQKDAKAIDLKIRAFNPFPGATLLDEASIIKVWNSSLMDDRNDQVLGEPGKIVNITQEGVELTCGKGSVLLTELQRAGGKKMAASQLAQTLGWKTGQVLS